MAYTAGWMAISSELAYYKQLFGPQVLLLMNIAYFLPSIPLLVVSSLLDDYMNNTFGRYLDAKLFFEPDQSWYPNLQSNGVYQLNTRYSIIWMQYLRKGPSILVERQDVRLTLPSYPD